VSNKIRVAFVKFGGLSAGGTEKFLQQIAANLPKDRFHVDYFYCDAAPYIGSDYKHGDTDPARLAYMQKNNVNLIKFNVRYKDVTKPTHDWVDTDFWSKFNEKNYDIVQTGRSGHPEYPFCLIKNTPIVDSIHLTGMTDNQPNIAKVIHVSEWNRDMWVKAGGDQRKVEVVYLPIEAHSVPKTDNLREAFNLEGKFVVGLHQRDDENIFSPWPIEAFSKMPGDDNVFLLLGGSKKHAMQAEQLGLKNFVQIPFTGDMQYVYRFLNTLDVYAHGRWDGEVNSQAIAEALSVGLPVVTHLGAVSNGHVEIMKTLGFVHGDFYSYVFDLVNYKSNPKYRAWISQRSKDRFKEKYSFDSIIQKICSIYEDVAQNRHQETQPDSWMSQWLNT
jgi:glycosyltransferase involved in cell wall biosynthesis